MFPRRFDVLAAHPARRGRRPARRRHRRPRRATRSARSCIQRAADRLAERYRFPVDGRSLEERIEALHGRPARYRRLRRMDQDRRRLTRSATTTASSPASASQSGWLSRPPATDHPATAVARTPRSRRRRTRALLPLHRLAAARRSRGRIAAECLTSPKAP